MTYRYRYFQQWSDGKSVMFIGLNPSCSASLNPTLRRCIKLADSWGFGSCYIVNLFAFRAQTPAELKQAVNPIGPENDKWIADTISKVDMVVFVWGIHGTYLDRDKQIIDLIKPAYCLDITKGGFPKHPLYSKRGVIVKLFTPALNLKNHD